jgi:hypothetical protein
MIAMFGFAVRFNIRSVVDGVFVDVLAAFGLAARQVAVLRSVLE